MVYQTISHEINFILFLIVNGIELCIGTVIFILFSFSEYNLDGSLDIKINWKLRHTLAYIIVIIGFFQLFLCGGCVRLITMSNVCTKCEVIDSIEFDGSRYTVNDNIQVDYKSAYYSTEIEESVVVERRKKICWVAGIDTYISYYEILFNEEDYNKFFSQDISLVDNNNYNLANFVYSKYSIEVYDLDESNNSEHKDKQETKEASIKVEKQEELSENWNQEVLEELHKKLSSISSNINSINKNMQEQKKELENQKKEIEELKENKPMDTGKVGAIIGGIVAFWIMTLVTIVTFVKLHVHSKKELILTASDAKIREGVMLNEDD